MKNYITFILGKIYDNTQVFYKKYIFDKNNRLSLIINIFDTIPKLPDQ